jgi:hypothetical protein
MTASAPSISPFPHRPSDLSLYRISRRLHRIEILCIALGKSFYPPFLILLHMLEFVSPERDVLFCVLRVPEEDDVADFVARGVVDSLLDAPNECAITIRQSAGRLTATTTGLV